MRFRSPFSPVAIAMLSLACASRSVVPEVHLDKLHPVPHVIPAEATVANAGAERCSLSRPSDLGSLEKNAEFILGFGERGGLVAWSSTAGLHVRPLTGEGAFVGPEVRIPLDGQAKPIEIAPLGPGFLIVSERVEYQPSLCESHCVDATCAGWPAGSAQPHVCMYSCAKLCKVPVRNEFVLQLVDLSGTIVGEPTSFNTARADVEAVILGEGRSLGLMTSNEIVWVQTDEQRGLTMLRQPLPQMQYALPVRGKGPPTLLALTEDGAMQSLNERGERRLEGSVVDPRAGRILDARLQARWDATGRVYLAKQAWLVALDAIEYSVIENGKLVSLGEVQRGFFREPFAEYVEPHFEEGRFRRRSWIQRAIGADIDLHESDLDADVSRARFVWTGKTFRFVYPTRSSDSSTLRMIDVWCAERDSRPN